MSEDIQSGEYEYNGEEGYEEGYAGVDEEGYAGVGEEGEEIDPDYLFEYGEDEDIFCEICQCTMSGPKSFESHVAGNRHKKNVRNQEMGAPVKKKGMKLPEITFKDGKRVDWEPKCQKMIDSCKEALLGLEIVTEWCHRNRGVEPRYFCNLCKAKCDVRMFVSHMTGVKHRLAYMKLYHPECAEAVKMEKRKLEQAPIADRLAHKLEEKYGRQKMRVMAEGFFGFNDEEYEELPPPVTANKDLGGNMPLNPGGPGELIGPGGPMRRGGPPRFDGPLQRGGPQPRGGFIQGSELRSLMDPIRPLESEPFSGRFGRERDFEPGMRGQSGPHSGRFDGGIDVDDRFNSDNRFSSVDPLRAEDHSSWRQEHSIYPQFRGEERVGNPQIGSSFLPANTMKKPFHELDFNPGEGPVAPKRRRFTEEKPVDSLFPGLLGARSYDQGEGVQPRMGRSSFPPRDNLGCTRERPIIDEPRGPLGFSQGARGPPRSGAPLGGVPPVPRLNNFPSGPRNGPPGFRNGLPGFRDGSAEGFRGRLENNATFDSMRRPTNQRPEFLSTIVETMSNLVHSEQDAEIMTDALADVLVSYQSKKNLHSNRQFPRDDLY